mgnify:CR=1 FL=1
MEDAGREVGLLVGGERVEVSQVAEAARQVLRDAVHRVLADRQGGAGGHRVLGERQQAGGEEHPVGNGLAQAAVHQEEGLVVKRVVDSHPRAGLDVFPEGVEIPELLEPQLTYDEIAGELIWQGTMTDDQEVSIGIRGLGWDKRTGYSSNRGEFFSARAYGHGGFTGTSLWMDPHTGVFVVFMSSRLHPDGKGDVTALRARVATAAAAALAALLVVRAAMKPLATLNRPTLKTVDVATKEETVSFKERTDVTAVPAMGVVAETMVALVLATEALRKFGGDSLDELRRNHDAYVRSL